MYYVCLEKKWSCFCYTNFETDGVNTKYRISSNTSRFCIFKFGFIQVALFTTFCYVLWHLVLFCQNGDVINQKSATYLPIEDTNKQWLLKIIFCYCYAQLKDMVQIFVWWRHRFWDYKTPCMRGAIYYFLFWKHSTQNKLDILEKKLRFLKKDKINNGQNMP